MPIETIKRKITGGGGAEHEIVVNQFHAVKGFALKARLYKMVLPVIGELVGGVDMAEASKGNQDAMAGIDIQAILPKALLRISETVEVKKFISLVMDLLSETWLDGKELNEKNFDDIFVADYSLIYKIVYAVVDINNFFDLGDIGSQLKDSLSKKTPVSPEKLTA